MIPFKRLNFEGSGPEIQKLLQSGFIGLGNKVTEFENELKKFLGCKYVVATDSCTSALFISIKYETEKLPLKKLLEYETYSHLPPIVIPSMMVPLVANAVLEADRRVSFDDNIKWVGSAYSLGNSNIWDSAHQLERNIFVNPSTDVKMCFSFYPTKPIGSADGGAIATNDEAFATWARSVVTYGRNQTQSYNNSWEYDIERIGYKRHYTNLQAVICLAQLKKLDEVNEQRRKLLEKFNDAFNQENKSLYLYRLKIKNRDKVISGMKNDGIECGVHFKPLHLMKAYQNIPFSGSRKLVEEEYEQTISLPFYETLTPLEQTRIIKSFRYFKTKYGN